MSLRPKNLMYVVPPEFIAQLNDLQDDLLESLTSISEGFEQLKDVVESLDIHGYDDIFGEPIPHEAKTPFDASF